MVLQTGVVEDLQNTLLGDMPRNQLDLCERGKVESKALDLVCAVAALLGHGVRCRLRLRLDFYMQRVSLVIRVLLQKLAKDKDTGIGAVHGGRNLRAQPQLAQNLHVVVDALLVGVGHRPQLDGGDAGLARPGRELEVREYHGGDAEQLASAHVSPCPPLYATP